MSKNSEIVRFEDNSDIRRAWHNDEWYYSIVDVVSVLADNKRPRKYWSDLKTKLTEEGYFEVSEKIGQLKLESSDGKKYLTDVVNRKTILRIIQSIPSPKVESLKLWLAQLGEERLEETEDPELGINRSRERFIQIHKARGMSDEWIKTRLDGINVRNQLTDEWKDRGIEDGLEFAILTNTIHEGIFDVPTQGHKKIKNIPIKENLRRHMNEIELGVTSLTEIVARKIHQDRDSQGFNDLKKDATDAGKAGGEYRKITERALQEPVISPQNNLSQRKQVKKTEDS